LVKYDSLTELTNVRWI